MIQDCNSGGWDWGSGLFRKLQAVLYLCSAPFPASGPASLNTLLTLSGPSPQYSKHLFVHIGQTNPAFSDPPLEAVDVRQIYDKFPEKKGGLKELYEKGPPNAFFLVKFWVSPPGPLCSKPPFPTTEVQHPGPLH